MKKAKAAIRAAAEKVANPPRGRNQGRRDQAASDRGRGGGRSEGDPGEGPVPRPAAHGGEPLLSKGHSLKAVSQWLGHANPTMTLRVYAHTMPNDDAKLAEGLARLMA